ncbi:hypothetical protein LL946_08195 [Knoellia locipacati]|uniref:hypothetical protein n=1 Tax=Knoellia locipacati TaxID=882824 RepID=UPI00384AA71A
MSASPGGARRRPARLRRTHRLQRRRRGRLAPSIRGPLERRLPHSGTPTVSGLDLDLDPLRIPSHGSGDASAHQHGSSS